MFVPVTSGGPEPTVKTVNESTQTETSEEKLESQMESKRNDRNWKEGKQEGREVTKGGGGQDTRAHTGKNLVILHEIIALLQFVDESMWSKKNCFFKSLYCGELLHLLIVIRVFEDSSFWFLSWYLCVCFLPFLSHKPSYSVTEDSVLFIKPKHTETNTKNIVMAKAVSCDQISNNCQWLRWSWF